MKAQFFKLLVITIVISTVSCNKEKKKIFTDYQYADNPETITCRDLDTKLLKEAIYSFENDISIHFDAERNSIVRANSRLIRESLNGTLKPENIVSKHTVELFKELKKDKTLWDMDGTKSKLNYNSEVINCIAENIVDDRIKSIFNSLKSTNSLSPKLFGEAIKDRTILMMSDKYLTTYVALEFYYAKLFNVDLTNIIFEDRAPTLDFNRKPTQQKIFNSNSGAVE